MTHSAACRGAGVQRAFGRPSGSGFLQVQRRFRELSGGCLELTSRFVADSHGVPQTGAHARRQKLMTDHDATPGGPAYPQDGPSRADNPVQPTAAYPQGTYPYPQAGYGQAAPGQPGQPGHPGYPGYPGYAHPGYGHPGYGQGGYPPPSYPVGHSAYAGYPGGPESHQSRSGKTSKKIMAGVAAGAFAIGAGGTALATGAIHSPIHGNRPLSTAAIVSKADPAVVDIVSKLGDQGAAAAGT